MIIDLTGLSGKSLPAEHAILYVFKNLPKEAEAFDYPFTGSLCLGTELGQTISIVGALVKRVILDSSSVTVVLMVPSPVPSYKCVNFVELTLFLSQATNRWEINSPGSGWYKSRDELKGELNQWLRQLDRSAISLKFDNVRKGFPLNQLGIAQKMMWEAGDWDHHMHIGLFPNTKGGTVLLLVPTWDLEKINSIALTGLRLFGLGKTALGCGDCRSWTGGPVFLGRAIHSPSIQPWRAIVQWRPLTDELRKNQNRLKVQPLLDMLWNAPVKIAMVGWRVQRSAQPLVPLPRLLLQDDNDDLEKMYQPILVFDVPNPSKTEEGAKAKLRYVHLHSKTGKLPIKAEFGWQVDGTSNPPLFNHQDRLIFEGDIDSSPVALWATSPTDSDGGDWVNTFEEACKPLGEDGQGEWLAQWTAGAKKTGKIYRGDKEIDRWIIWGSLEIKLEEDSTAELHCNLRGEWTEQKCDVYPESVLTIDECLVRVSSATDVAGKDLNAAFGTLDEYEDNLQRDSEPLRFSTGTGQSGRLCQVRITHRCMPGRNAVTRVEVFSPNRQPLGEESVIMQMRPFFVGVVQPADLDPEGGRLIAVWNSNDPEGVQWRVPDATTSVTFQPQAVGESMERGVRFWQKPLPGGGTPEPWLDPDKPVLYRFSPPTQLIVRPSVRERRYNKSPSNLGAVLANAKVDSFTTEMVYPVEAKFQVSDQGLPDIRIAETASMLGRPAENLEPLPAEAEEKTDHPFERWLRVAFSSEAATYAATVKNDLRVPLNMLRASHAAAKANFAARLAQFHVYDPWSAQGGLALKEGVTFTIRDTRSGAPPLANPLAQWKLTLPPKEAPPGTKPTAEQLGTDLTAQQKAEISKFLSKTKSDWGTLAEGSIPAGVVHTMEFASELVAVLRTPTTTRGQIESLAFSALGATGQMSVSFDEGRTTFIAESSFGQLSRLIKVRIGRIGVLWNKAKHVIVYERTTAYSKQFEDEQGYGDASGPVKDKPSGPKCTLGWPILRKTEEYVEPIETVRTFDKEREKDDNRTGFLVASEFVTLRVYVNGTWGRALEHGYEIPLWNADDQTGFYPKPQLALQARAAGTEISRCWLDEPDQLVFYTNTEPGTGDDPDKWKAQHDVDCPNALARLPLSMENLDTKDPNAAQKFNRHILDSKSMPSPRLGAMRRPRFDLAVRSDGKVNLQHERGETQMLATLDVVSIARTSGVSQATADDLSASTAAQKILKDLQQATQKASQLDAARSLQARAHYIIARTAEQLVRAGSDCTQLKRNLETEIRDLFASARSEIYSALNALPALPAVSKDALPFVVGVVGMQQQLYNYERSLRAPFDKVLADLEQLRLNAQQAGEAVRDDAKKQIESARELVTALVKTQRDQLDTFCNQVLKASVNGGVDDLTTILVTFNTAAGNLSQAVNESTPNLKDARIACAYALGALQKVRSHVLVGSLARQLESSVLLVDRFLADADAEVLDVWETVQSQMKTLGKALEEIASVVKSAGDEAKRFLEGLIAAMDELVGKITGKIAEATTAIYDSVKPINVALGEAIDHTSDIHDLAGSWRKSVDDSMKGLYQKAIDADAKLLAVAQGAIDVAKKVAQALLNATGSASNWLTTREAAALDLIGTIDCTQAEKLVSQLLEKLQQAEDEIRKRLTDQANEILDGQTRQKLVELEKEVMATVPQFAKQAGQAIKLVKALGELPALPTLTFNADRAEYIFDDFKKQIETSPFAAKLGEIDSGLKQLGIAVPANQLLDQIIPMSLENLDFNKVFKNFGAIDFKGLLEKFKLPSLKSEQIKITQGVDKATRSAWVMTKINADFPEQQSLFEFSGLSVTLAQMKLRADSDMRVGINGDRSSKTDALLTADWGLQFGGASLAKFSDVTVRFNGSSFKFDIEPRKVEFHPSLKFVDEFAKRFQPDLPPAVEIEKDSRGIPVGARASMVTNITLPPLGIVEIGPLKIASGLVLRMAEDGQFMLVSNVSMGSKTAPVWVQIGYLGGGLWFEAKATFQGSVTYSASVGLAIGCIRAINVAGVAQGSFALLLFAYAEISDSGGSLRVGFSMAGSARILGMCNASVLLLLEAEHKNGNTEGHGTLDVKVDICWCYTLHVRREVNHKIS